MSSKAAAFESSRNQVAYLLNRSDLTDDEREDIKNALLWMDALLATKRNAPSRTP